MNYSATTKNNLLKRRSSSVNTNREQKQKRPDFPCSSSQTSSHRQNGSIHVKSSEIRPKSTASRGIIPDTLANIPQSIPPPVAPRKTKIKPPPTPKERKSINKHSDIVEEQITTFKPVNESKKILPPILKNTNQILSEQKTSQSTPYTPGLCGLINIGNTCFMNSALQCLSNIPELTQWAKDQTQNSSTQNNDIIYAYTSLIQSMWSGKYDNINPRNIKEIISHSAPIFTDYGQKDSHEFLNSLLNALERRNSTSIISNLFHIHTQSQVTCTGCHFIDLTNEITTFLPLPLPKKTFNNQEISLENLIHDYCLEDNLDGLYYCHSCQKYTQAKQKTNIAFPLPRVLIIQLKRFPFDNTYKKIDTFIRYKLQYQNLISNNDIYQLCAVSSHVGNLASGHYTTLAKNNLLKQWYRFNDSRIEKINFDSVITSNAYVLVYVKSEEFDSLIS